jgi:hypothetical protein
MKIIGLSTLVYEIRPKSRKKSYLLSHFEIAISFLFRTEAENSLPVPLLAYQLAYG